MKNTKLNLDKEIEVLRTIKIPVKKALFVTQHCVCYIDVKSEVTMIGTTGLADCIGLAVHNPSYNNIENNHKVALAHLDTLTMLESVKGIIGKMRVNINEHLKLTLVGGHQESMFYYFPIIGYLKNLANVSFECKLFPPNKALGLSYQKLIVDIFGSVDTTSSDKETMLLYVNSSKSKDIYTAIEKNEVFELVQIEFISQEFDKDVISLGEAGGFMPY